MATGNYGFFNLLALVLYDRPREGEAADAGEERQEPGAREGTTGGGKAPEPSQIALGGRRCGQGEGGGTGGA